MPSAAVEAAFQARLLAYTSDSPPVIPAIVSTQPDPDHEAFLVVQYPVVNGVKPVISRHYCEEGAARLVLNVRRSQEMATALSWADALASIFRDKKFDDVQTFTPSGPMVNDTSNDGNWFSLSVIVPYRYQFDD
jgi:hypothetical protein